MRAQSPFGSSSFWDASSIEYDQYFTGNVSENINFYNWNRFFFKYCDGSGHQGYLEQPLFLNDQDIYFRGQNITMANLNFVFSLLPPELTDTFVVNGCSAGGLATYTWLDTIADMINEANPSTKVFGLSDSGFFIDYPSFEDGKHVFVQNISALVSLVNQEVPIPNKKCWAENNMTNPHYCMMAEKLVTYIKTPFFIEESLYDFY